MDTGFEPDVDFVKIKKRLCEKPFDRLRINSATKQSADSRKRRLLRWKPLAKTG